MSSPYLFQSPPRARDSTVATTTLTATLPRKPTTDRYRDTTPSIDTDPYTLAQTNIMNDPRVRRGKTSGAVPRATQAPFDTKSIAANLPHTHTHAHSSSTTTTISNSASAPMSAASVRRANAARKKSLVSAGLIRPSLPSVAAIHDSIVVPKQRVPVPVHLYLVEQTPATDTRTHHTQTEGDAAWRSTTTIDTTASSFSSSAPGWLPESPDRGYLPRKTGIDASAQVDPAYVFDFDTGIDPLLEVLCTKTAEQALVEVREESEMSALVSEEKRLRSKRAEEMRVVNAMEETERVREQQRIAALASARAQAAQEAAVASKLAALTYARSYTQQQLPAQADLAAAHPDTLAAHIIDTAFLQPLVHTHVVPRVIDATHTAASSADALLLSAVDASQRAVHEATAKRAAEAAAVAAAEASAAAAAHEQAQRTRVVQLYIHSPSVAPEGPVGPLRLRADATVSQLRDRIWQWFESKREEQGGDDEQEESGAREGWPVVKEEIVLLHGETVLDCGRSETLYELGIVSGGSASGDGSSLGMRIEQDAKARGGRRGDDEEKQQDEDGSQREQQEEEEEEEDEEQV